MHPGATEFLFKTFQNTTLAAVQSPNDNDSVNNPVGEAP